MTWLNSFTHIGRFPERGSYGYGSASLEGPLRFELRVLAFSAMTAPGRSYILEYVDAYLKAAALEDRGSSLLDRRPSLSRLSFCRHDSVRPRFWLAVAQKFASYGRVWLGVLVMLRVSTRRLPPSP